MIKQQKNSKIDFALFDSLENTSQTWFPSNFDFLIETSKQKRNFPVPKWKLRIFLCGKNVQRLNPHKRMEKRILNLRKYEMCAKLFLKRYVECVRWETDVTWMFMKMLFSSGLWPGRLNKIDSNRNSAQKRKTKYSLPLSFSLCVFTSPRHDTKRYQELNHSCYSSLIHFICKIKQNLWNWFCFAIEMKALSA